MTKIKIGNENYEIEEISENKDFNIIFTLNCYDEIFHQKYNKKYEYIELRHSDIDAKYIKFYKKLIKDMLERYDFKFSDSVIDEFVNLHIESIG